MDPRLKQRLVGAAVLVALAVIFLPMLVKGPAPDSGVSDLPLRVPDAPTSAFRTVDLPLVTPGQAPQGGVLGAPAGGDEGALPTVDTASQPVADGDQAEDADPLPPTVAGGDYAVHYGSFASDGDARTVLRQLGDVGLAGYAEAYTLNDRQAHRVRLGPFATRAEAEIVRLRAASLREDVSPRVVALDAAQPASTTTAAATTPRPTPAASQPPATPPAAATTRTEPARTPTTAPSQAPTAAPAAQPTAAPNVGFVVQVTALRNATEATALRDRLRGQGIVAFTDNVDTDNGRLTRVKAGPVASREDAERLKSRVKTVVGIDGIVRQHP
ncbi:MAG: SPOR domain-containing protein [Luteimonas sp.]|nr:SPOR domain-containing protein [Luteimonas sp.]